MPNAIAHDGGQIVVNPDLPINIPQTSHNGIESIIFRGNLDAAWTSAIGNLDLGCDYQICDAHSIDDSLFQQEWDTPFQWEQHGDFSDEYSNIDVDNQPDDSDPYYVNWNIRWTHNIENMNTLDDLLYYNYTHYSTYSYTLIVDTNVFSVEEFEAFPWELMNEYASYETTPVICFIINGKPCYAILPDKIRTMSATTPILKYTGAAQIRIVDVTQIEMLISEMYGTPVVKPTPQPSTGGDYIIIND